MTAHSLVNSLCILNAVRIALVQGNRSVVLIAAFVCAFPSLPSPPPLSLLLKASDDFMSLGMEAINKTSLADSAAEAIRRDIASGRWAVGDRLPNETGLSAALSVSRGTVREAVRVLVSQGYLETRQGSGTYVVSLTDAVAPLSFARRSTLRDQFEARCALEVEGARLAALRCTKEDVAHLRTLLAARGSASGEGRTDFIRRDLAFHRAVISAARNLAMAEIYDFFSAAIAETIAATLADDIPEPDLEAHAAIIDAIETGDPDKADAAVRRFMAPVLAALTRMPAS